MSHKFKGKCGCVKKQTEPTPFSRKLLLALQHLQGNTRYHCGATIKEIARYMSLNFQLDGDVLSQVKISLEQNVYYGIVEKINNKYMLVGASAYVANTSEKSVKREKEIKRAHCIYPSVWKHRIPKRKSRDSLSTSCKTSCTSIISVLTSKGSKTSENDSLCSQSSHESQCRRINSCTQPPKRKRSISCMKQRRGRDEYTGQFCSLKCKSEHCLPENYSLKRCKKSHHMRVRNTSCSNSNYSSD